MGLITKEVETPLYNKLIKYYENLGYPIPREQDKKGDIRVIQGTKILGKVEDLLNKSEIRVDVICDNCDTPLYIQWSTYKQSVKEDGKYYCQKCAVKLSKTKLKKSFYNWCYENLSKEEADNIINRWDYELNNNIKPNEICYSTHKKYYFKCPRNLHESELKNIHGFVEGQKGSIECNKCNSFAQWCIDNICGDFLDRYWDWDKNIIDPWGISYGSKKSKIWIKCQEKKYHGSYSIGCPEFTNQNQRCSYCSNRYEIHPLDSLGTLYPKSLEVWSDKNKKSPYEYSPYSSQEVYWKCPEGKHEDYPRIISTSNQLDFRCPECSYSKGEESISNYFIHKNFIKICQEEYNKLINKDKYNKIIYYIPQKEFDELVGLRNGLLSYDFYLPIYNLLIEYHGMQHEKYCKGFHKSKKDFERQVEHDKRKCEYAQNNNINLLVIWYWDFDRIEEILDKELNKYN